MVFNNLELFVESRRTSHSFTHLADRFSEAFVEKYYQLLDKDKICTNPHLSEQFFRRHPELINHKIGGNIAISPQFILEYRDKIFFW